MDMVFLSYLLIINITGFLLMYIDKSKARKKQWRISESTLLSVAIAGGSIGSLLGMQFFRHKTKHVKFTLGIPVIMIIQISILSYFLTY
ncbi:MAG: DUF1294 domain-containing protein [Peptostreptococcaceae bacterium]